MNPLNDLELALRKLPGVRSAGFTERDNTVFVQVHTEPSAGDSGLALQVTRLASRHTDLPVAVELVRWQNRSLREDATSANGSASHEQPDAAVDLTSEDLSSEELSSEVQEQVGREARVKLLAVLSFPDTDEIEVHLTLAGQRTIGRAVGSRGLIAAVDATVDALRAIVPGLVFTPSWAREVESTDDAGHIVAVGLSDGRAPRHGIAAGDTAMEAAARASLDALNRTVALELAPAD